MKVVKKELKRALDDLSIFTDVTEDAATKRIGFLKEGGKISLYATSLVSAGCSSFECEDDGVDVSFQVPQRALRNATFLPDGDIAFKVEGDSLVVSDSNTVLAAEATEELSLASYDEIFAGFTEGVDFESAALKRVIKNGSFSRNENDFSRPFIQGAYLSLSDGSLSVRSTDAKRLSVSAIDSDSPLSFSGTLNSNCIKAINSVRADSASIFLDDKRFIISSDGFTACLPLIDCEYPDTDRFFSSDELQRIEVETAAMNKAISMVSAISDDGVLSVDVSGSSLTIGFGYECKSKTTIGIGNDAGVSFAFLIDVILVKDIFKTLGASKIEIGYSKEFSPVEYDDGAGSRGVVMPLRK